MEFTGAGPRRDRNGRAAVTPFFRGSIISRDLVLLNIIGRDAIEVAHRIRHRRFVRLDPVDRNVVSAVARAVDVNSRSRAAEGTLHDAWLKQQQRQRIPSVERQRFDRFLLDHISDRRVRVLELLGAAAYRNGFRDLADLKRAIDGKWFADLQGVIGFLQGFESLLLDGDGVLTDRQ